MPVAGVRNQIAGTTQPRHCERSQERNSRRSGSRDRSGASLTDDRYKSSSSNREQSATKEPRKFLLAEEYRRFQESLRSAHESVVKQCFPSGSSPKRTFSVQNSAPADEHDEPEVSEPEYRALIAAALGDDYDEIEDGQLDK